MPAVATEQNAAAAGNAFESSMAYATEEGDHVLHKIEKREEDWEDYSAHLAELIAKMARKLAASAAASTLESSLDYATEEGDHVLHKIEKREEDWEDYDAHLQELIAKLAPKLKAQSAASAYEGSMGYATEEGDHVLHKVREGEEDWEDHASRLAELIAKLAPKLKAEAAASSLESSLAYASEEGDHVLRKIGKREEDWEDYDAHLQELIAKLAPQLKAAAAASALESSLGYAEDEGDHVLHKIEKREEDWEDYSAHLAELIAKLAPKLQAEKAAGAYEGSMGYATEEGDHVLHKIEKREEDWEDYAAHLAELIAKMGVAGAKKSPAKAP